MTPGRVGEGPHRQPLPGSAPVKPKKHRSRGQRILRGSAIALAVILVAAGSLYGYVRWRLSEIKSAHCTTCTAVASGAPYNVLLVGSDSRADDSGSQDQAFGTTTQVAGQRSDTIKIVHIDPQNQTARILSIPRDTFVQLSDIPASTGLSTDNKINAAFNNGPDPLIATIQNTFGIPISHYVVVDFDAVINLVNAVGGINLDFKYPVRDDDDGNNNSGLNIPNAGCQTLNGNQALALSRSRYYQYYEDGYWQSDPTSDLGRIQRQNEIIEAVIDKVKGTIDPLTLNSFLSAVVHDITKDDGLSATGLISLAENYHAFSTSDLQTYTLPTISAQTSDGSDVEVVSQPQALQTIEAFLGTSPNAVTTAPIDQYGSAIPTPTTTTPPPSTGSGSSASSGNAGSSGSSGSGQSSSAPGQSSLPPYDPTPC